MKVGNLVVPSYTIYLFDTWETGQKIISRVESKDVCIVLDTIQDEEDDYAYVEEKSYEVLKVLCKNKVGWTRSSMMKLIK